MHEDEDTERTPCDVWHDYVPNSYAGLGYYQGAYTDGPSSDFHNVPSQQGAGAPSGTPVANSDSDATVVRRFFEEAVVISSGEALMSLAEMRAYVHGKIRC